MRPVPPLGALLVHQAQICLVYQRRTLQRVPFVLSRQVAARDIAQFVVDERHEAVESASVALAPADQQIRNSRQLLYPPGMPPEKIVALESEFAVGARNLPNISA